MIPALVAEEIRETVVDYLRTTWGLSDRALEAALFDFLEGRSQGGAGNIFRGPYLRLRLPFAPKPPDATVPLEIRPSYDPYLHQLQAWRRLSSRDHVPQPTLVTTGTGSGKTECFLYPLLDHCHRALERGEAGIKAIVLYPMNALAADQARRIAETIAGDSRLAGKLRVGMYVGGEGRNREMGPSSVIDDREQLRRKPPDILLTNYRMLDFLLLRPKDQVLWKHNRPGTLRYLVLDELHTYDGAQGTDVACLIRRLTARLGGQDALCPVGTSATVASGEGDGQRDLLEFASTVFDQPFGPDSIVGETRVSPEEFFAAFGSPLEEVYPREASALEPDPNDDAERHVRSIARRWFPEARLEASDGTEFRLALGRAAIRHPLARALVHVAGSGLVDRATLDEKLRESLSGFRAQPEALRDRLVTSMLSLLSWSLREVGPRRQAPLVQVQVQLWVREVRRLLREVGPEPRFAWRDERPQGEGTPALPMYYCRECGHSGWLTCRLGLGMTSEVSTDYARIADAYRAKSQDLIYLHTDPHATGDGDNPLTVEYFDPQTRRLGPPTGSVEGLVRVFRWTKCSKNAPPRDLRACPVCDAEDALSMLASRSATLASVSVGHLYTTPLNTDRKLLAFSDSVQDASHRAGFFSGRTYRFSIRSAMLAVVPEGGGAIRLSDMAPAMFEYWSTHRSPGETLDPEAAMIAAFLPHDLEYLPEYQAYVTAFADRAQRKREAEERGEPFDEPLPRPPSGLLSKLRQRMRWEVTREFGVAARIGRTLERSGAASVALEPERFEQALALVSERVPQRLGAARDVGPAAFRQFLVGLLTRLRLRGGVYDELLRAYVEGGGNGYHLSKARQPLLSPFGPRTTRPLFLTNAAQGRFDNVQPKERGNWYTDWIERSLGLSLPLVEARDLYGEILPLLVEARILVVHDGGRWKAWGLDPSALVVSRRHGVRTCSECGFEQPTVEGSASDPLGHPCPRYRCRGLLGERKAERMSRAQSYYRRFYERKALGRVWSREHTGLLDRSDREDLELEFKECPRPDAPNMLSCTPTLEMGIDIGDLSATMLCSVPPNTANYLQRVGRAGRSTGNALILTFASSQQHDLHFYKDPLAVMDGAIRPPGCYLDAPEVLKRQALAFCLDNFAREDGKVPGRMRELLAGGTDTFPAPFIAFVDRHRTQLRDRFFELFDKRVLRPESRAKLEAFFAGQGSGTSELERRLLEQIEGARKRRDELRGLIKRINERLGKLQEDAAAKKIDDIEQEKQSLLDEKRYLGAELSALLDGDVWGWLCEASLLPNYAFPEAGVKLQAFLLGEQSGSEGEASSREYSWVRAPAAAISELAPFNTFYGSGHKVQIDNVALGKDGGVEWQFCGSCHHSAPVAELGDEGDDCPACGTPGWREKGRRRRLVRMHHVRAFSRRRDAVVSDETESRERASYELHNFYDVGDAPPKNAWSNETDGFGFEFLPLVRLRRVNFGERDSRADTSELGGRPVADVGFDVCADCGQVRRPPTRMQGEKKRLHRAACPSRNKDEKKQPWTRVHLYRELQSEAIRLVLPVSRHDVTARVANVRAALRLGLREFYGGDPQHLGVDTYDEPAAHGDRRHFLLIQDLVPGGTGLLAELTEDKGAKLRRVLEMAREALVGCPCRHTQPEVPACYRCLYAYREQQVLHLLDRKVALELLNKMLGAFDALRSVETIGTLSVQSILESELEHRFRETLRGFAEQPGVQVEELPGEQIRVRLNGRSWRYQPQVTLKEDEVLLRCRPDFVLFPEDQEPEVRAVAGFADGAAYHVLPNEPVGRIHDDFAKRAGIVASGKYVVWSFGWEDLDAYHRNDDLGSWTDKSVLDNLETLLNHLNLRVGNPASADPVRALLGYLTYPLHWPQFAACLAAAALHAAGKPASAEAVNAELEEWAAAEHPNARLAEPAEAGEMMWARLTFGAEREGTVLLAAPRTGKLYRQPERVQGVLRLADGAAQRAKSHYTRSWRMFLRAYNVLQFLPNVRVVTDEQMTAQLRELEGELETLPPSLTSAPIAAEAPSALPAAEREALAELEAVSAGWARVVAGALGRGHHGIVVPFEVRTPEHSGDIELAWPARRVGLFLEEQRDTAAYLRAQGWRLLRLDADPSPDQLIAILEDVS